MFGIGPGEFLLIFIVLIIAVGPDKLPIFMKTVGKTIRGLRNASREIRSSVGIDELMREDMLNPPRPRPRPRPAPSPEEGQPVSRQDDVARDPTTGLPAKQADSPESDSTPPGPRYPKTPERLPPEEALPPELRGDAPASAPEPGTPAAPDPAGDKGSDEGSP